LRQIKEFRGFRGQSAKMLANPAKQAAAATNSGCLVWIVEDDEAVASSLAFSLEAHGYRVKTCHTGAETLEAASSNCCRLVIDYILPDTTGLRLLRRLRAVGLAAPALFITTEPSSWLREQADRAGTPIVEKPLLGDALFDAVHALGCSCGRERT
jgi:two-component system response regulator FixJ